MYNHVSLINFPVLFKMFEFKKESREGGGRKKKFQMDFHVQSDSPTDKYWCIAYFLFILLIQFIHKYDYFFILFIIY